MSTIRMLPSAATFGGAHTTTIVNGRTYTATAGTTADVPDFDAAELEANGWLSTAAGGSGTTAQRPTTGLFAGMKYLDTTLGYVVMYDGATWRNPNSGASV